MIESLTQKFKTLTNSLDIFYVIKDVKPCARILVSDSEIESFIKNIRELKLKTAIPDFKVEKYSEKDKGYSNLGVRLNLMSPVNGVVFAYISKSQNTCESAKQAEHMGDQSKLGKILGYPDCCVEFFNNFFPIQSRRSNDYVFPALYRSKRGSFPFQNNICARSMDLTLLSHFPCNLNCEKSKKMAEKNLALIKEDNEELDDKLIELLKNTVIYTSLMGVLILKNSRKEDDAIYYDDVIATEKNELYDLLKNNKSIKLLDINKFSVDGRIVENQHIAVIEFI